MGLRMLFLHIVYLSYSRNRTIFVQCHDVKHEVNCYREWLDTRQQCLVSQKHDFLRSHAQRKKNTSLRSFFFFQFSEIKSTNTLRQSPKVITMQLQTNSFKPDLHWISSNMPTPFSTSSLSAAFSSPAAHTSTQRVPHPSSLSFRSRPLPRSMI